MFVPGQLRLRKIPASKNPAAMLTQHLPASSLPKLLSKLGVRIGAAYSKDLLSVLNLETFASPNKASSSFFIVMMAKHPDSSACCISVASNSLSSNSLQQPTREAVSNLQSSQRTFSLSSFWSYFFVIALLCAATYVFYNLVSFQMYGLFLSATLVLTQLCTFIVFVCDKLSSTRTSLRRALGTTSSSSSSSSSSLAFRSLSTPSLQRSMLSTNHRTQAQLQLPQHQLCLQHLSVLILGGQGSCHHHLFYLSGVRRFSLSRS